jgi:hypothetical protein
VVDGWEEGMQEEVVLVVGRVGLGLGPFGKDFGELSE